MSGAKRRNLFVVPLPIFGFTTTIVLVKPKNVERHDKEIPALRA